MSLVGSKDLLKNADAIILLAGSGMSAEIGLSTYWSDTNAKYASHSSEFGYTTLEHATATLWETNPEIQSQYFRNLIVNNNEIIENSVDTVYDELLQYLTKEQKPYFVFTSNTDSAFYLKGFKESRLNEVHGSYRYLQCLLAPVGHEVFPTELDNNHLVVCPTCGSPSRPNVLFFNDPDINPVLLAETSEAYLRFRKQWAGSKLVALEIGAGGTIPTVRNQSVILNSNFDVPVIRVNPKSEDDVVDGIAGFMKKSKTAPFYELPFTASEGLSLLLP